MNDQLARQANEVSAILKQLAHPDRLKVLCSLLEKEKTVGELVEYAGASQSWVSQFLSRMKLEGLVESRKEGTSVHYRIADPRLRTLMQAIYRTYCTGAKQKKG
jgi:ArsR family transcriptional regulator, virulence genes transcriptional regulator